MFIGKSSVRSRAWKVGLATLLTVPAVAGTALAAQSGNLGLQFNKTADRSQATVGKNLTFTITDTNTNSNQDVRNLTISDNLPSGVSLVRATASDSNGSVPCTTDGTVTCGSFTLSPGETATVTIIVKPTQRGNITNIASDNAGNRDSVTVQVNKKKKHHHRHRR